MKSVRRRGTTPLAALFASAVIVASTLSPLAARVAAGQSIQQTRAEIASLSAQLARQEKSSEVTANAYDAQKAQLDTLTADIHALQTQEVAERALVIRTTRHMVKAVVRSYVYGTTNDQVIALFNQNVGANDSRQVFERLVVGNLNGLRIKLDHQRTKLFGEIATLSSEHARANATARNLQALLAQNIAAADQTRATLTSVTATLKSEIIAYEVAAGAAAARTRDTAAESSAIAAASEVGGQAAANEVLAAIAANTPRRPRATRSRARPPGRPRAKRPSPGPRSKRACPTSGAARHPAWASTARASCSGRGARWVSPSPAPPRHSGPRYRTSPSPSCARATCSTTTTSTATEPWTTW